MTEAAGQTVQTGREPYVDYLKVFAAFAVIFLHVSTENYANIDVTSVPWRVMDFYNSAASWCVDVFIMVSGALFLGRQIPLRKLYGKYVLRMVTAFVFWNLVYVAAGADKIELIIGHFHMWYIPMIVGMYICVPIIQRILGDRRITYYYIVLSILLCKLRPTLIQLAVDFGGSQIATVAKLINQPMNTGVPALLEGQTLLMICGYLLGSEKIDRKRARAICTAGAAAFLLIVTLNILYAGRTGIADGPYRSGFLGFVFSCAVFVFFRGRNWHSRWWNERMRALSRYTFGIYLVHPLILNGLEDLGLNNLSFHPLVSIPVIASLIFALSLGISWLLHRIPVLNRYVV